MSLFRKDKLGKKIRSRYELDCSAERIIQKIFKLKDMELDKAIVKFDPE